jgi:hypothetical protein
MSVAFTLIAHRSSLIEEFSSSRQISVVVELGTKCQVDVRT